MSVQKLLTNSTNGTFNIEHK